jgi:hypothetical protein
MRQGLPLLLLVLSHSTNLFSQTPRVFFGNLHSHTAYSDGTGTPRDAFDFARTTGKLDFLCVSEHNHAAAEGTGDDPRHLHIALDHTLYNGSRADSLISAANAVNTQFAGTFVALYGQEFSAISHGNHINVFDVGEVIDEHLIPNREFRKLYDNWLVNHLDTLQKPAIVQFNHPNDVTQDYGIVKYPDTPSFLAGVSPYVRTIAILSGPHDTKPGDPVRHNDNFDTNAYLHYLNLGLRLAPAADGDNHFITFGTSTDHRTAVWAASLTKENLLEAIRNNHVYSTQDKNLIVDFRINGQMMGSAIPANPGDTLAISVQLTDPDEPGAAYHISLRHDTVGGEIEALNEVDSTDVSGDSTVHFDSFKYTGGVEYYLVQVVQSGTGKPDQAWTAPIWLTAAPTNDEHPAPPPDDQAGFVWSVNSRVYHLASCKDAQRISETNRRAGNTPPPGKTLHANCPVR